MSEVEIKLHFYERAQSGQKYVYNYYLTKLYGHGLQYNVNCRVRVSGAFDAATDLRQQPRSKHETVYSSATVSHDLPSLHTDQDPTPQSVLPGSAMSGKAMLGLTSGLALTVFSLITSLLLPTVFPLPFPFPAELPLPLPSNMLSLPAEGLVIEPTMLSSCGVGAARTEEAREKREMARNVEVFIVRSVEYATI